MKYPLIYCMFVFFLLAFWSCETKQPDENKLFQFDLRWFALKDKIDCKIQKSAAFDKEVLFFKPAEKNNYITISGIGSKTDWGQAKYFICEVNNPGEFPEMVCLDFYAKKNEETENTKENPLVSPRIEIFPKQITKIVLPLDCLKGENVLIERIPGKPVNFNPREASDPNNIGHVHLSVSKTDLDSNLQLEIASMYLSNVKPENKVHKQTNYQKN